MERLCVVRMEWSRRITRFLSFHCPSSLRSTSLRSAESRSWCGSLPRERYSSRFDLTATSSSSSPGATLTLVTKWRGRGGGGSPPPHSPPPRPPPPPPPPPAPFLVEEHPP